MLKGVPRKLLGRICRCSQAISIGKFGIAALNFGKDFEIKQHSESSFLGHPVYIPTFWTLKSSWATDWKNTCSRTRQCCKGRLVSGRGSSNSLTLGGCLTNSRRHSSDLGFSGSSTQEGGCPCPTSMDWPLTRMVAEWKAKEGVSSLFSFLGMALSCCWVGQLVGWLFCRVVGYLDGWLSDCFVFSCTSGWWHSADWLSDAWLPLTSLVWWLLTPMTARGYSCRSNWRFCLTSHMVHLNLSYNDNDDNKRHLW